MKIHIRYCAILLLVAGCAETSIQPLTQSSFKVATEAECGAKETREIAFKAAAIEVINRGSDRFIVLGDQSGSQVTGGQYTGFGGFQTYSNNLQDMVIQIVQKGDPRYGDSLSARQTLGTEWQTIVAEGAPIVCSLS